MQKFLLVICLCMLFGLNVFGQKGLDFIESSKSSQIKDIQVFNDNSGIAYTQDSIFRTDNNGETWREINLPKESHQIISSVNFADEQNGSVIIADYKNVALNLLQTTDSGNNWTSQPMNLRTEDLQEADLSTTSLQENLLYIRMQTSSNFIGNIVYQTNDLINWNLVKRESKLKTSDEVINILQRWNLKSEGNCENRKLGCVQETKIFNGKTDITPPQIVELSRLEKEKLLRKLNQIIDPFNNGSDAQKTLNEILSSKSWKAYKATTLK